MKPESGTPIIEVKNIDTRQSHAKGQTALHPEMHKKNQQITNARLRTQRNFNFRGRRLGKVETRNASQAKATSGKAQPRKNDKACRSLTNACLSRNLHPK